MHPLTAISYMYCSISHVLDDVNLHLSPEVCPKWCGFVDNLTLPASNLSTMRNYYMYYMSWSYSGKDEGTSQKMLNA